MPGKSATVLEQAPSAAVDASSTAAASPLIIRSNGICRKVPNKLARRLHVADTGRTGTSLAASPLR